MRYLEAEKSTTRHAWTTMFSIAVLAFSVAACSEARTVQGAPGDLTDLDSSHPAAALISDGVTDFDAFSGAALDQGLDFVCGSGGLPPYQLCLVAEDGVLAIVPLSGVNEQVVRLTDPALSEDVVVPMDTEEPVGVLNVGPRVTVQVEYLDEVVGDLMGLLESLR